MGGVVGKHAQATFGIPKGQQPHLRVDDPFRLCPDHGVARGAVADILDAAVGPHDAPIRRDLLDFAAPHGNVRNRLGFEGGLAHRRGQSLNDRAGKDDVE